MRVEAYHNWELEKAIRESGLQAIEVAKKAGVDSAKLSHIKRGRMRPTDEEEIKIAEALGTTVKKLFINKDDFR